MGSVAGIATMTHDCSAENFAEEKFRLAVEACPSGIVMSDSAGVILLVNSAAEQMFGYRREELVGQHIGLLLPKRVHAEYFKDRAEYLRHPGPRRFYEGHALSCLRRNGSEFPVEVALNPIHTGESQIVLGMITDISERLRLDREKDEFVFNVSHELRTPLTSIVGSLGLVLGGAAGQLPQQAVRLVTIAHNNCQRLIRLINDILDIEKAESGKLEFHFKRLDLRALVEQVLEANRAYADGFGVTLRLDPAAADSEVYADPDRLAQVITNLLSNAIKFSSSHGEVLVSIAERGQTVRVAVRDHGPGIPREFRPRLFEKFAQADNTDARQRSGTGLGLSIVKQIVTRLGGTVGFEDANGGGTIFNVDLPTWSAIAAREIDHKRAVDGRRILLCEDDASAALSLRSGLRTSGYATDFAHCLADAIARAQANQYAALVVDLDLPNGSGRDLLRRLRAEPHIYRTPIVVISVTKELDKNDAAWADLNVHGCIVKPVDADQLAEMLNRAVAHNGEGRPRILHLDDDRNVLELVARALHATANVVSVESIDEARLALLADDFDLAIVDISLGAVSGLDLLPELRGQTGKPVPVIVFSAYPADLRDNPQVQASFDKARMSLRDLVASVHDRLRLQPEQPAKEGQ